MNLSHFLDREVGTLLEPGETMHARAYGRRPLSFSVAGVPQNYQPWLLVVTERRLIAFRTDTSLLGAVEARRHETEIWRYDELESIQVANVRGLFTGGARSLFLEPIAGFGPRDGKRARFDIAPTQPGLPDQERFHGQLIDWLAQQVAARAFPMRDELRAEIERRGAQRVQNHAAQQASAAVRSQLNAEIGSSMARWAPPVGAIGCGFLLLLASVPGCIFVVLEMLDGDFPGVLPILCTLGSIGLGIGGLVGGGALIVRARRGATDVAGAPT